MKVLLVGPEICAPWTEGRKNFVRDLVPEISRKVELRALLTATPGPAAPFTIVVDCQTCAHGATHLASILRRLPRVLRTWRPDFVVHFPYGTFRGIRGVANDWYIRAVDRMSLRAGAGCLTVMYSIDSNRTIEQVNRMVSRLGLAPRDDWHGCEVPIGINLAGWPEPHRTAGGKKLLFMAGMWQANAAALEHVITVRGLGLALSAGAKLAADGHELIVASPVLSDPKLCEKLYRHPLNRWPEGRMTLMSTVSVPDIYRDADAFLFPYHHHITQFTPTSVLEAFACGLPVVMSDLPFLRPLAVRSGAAILFERGNEDALVEAVRTLTRDRERYARMSREAFLYSRRELSIESAAAQLLDHLGAARPSEVVGAMS